MKNVSAFLKRHSALLLLVLVLATVPAGIAFGKYVKSVKVTSGISITVEEEKEYIIDKNKMWTALQGRSASNPTTLSFVKGSDVAEMQRVDTTGGIQAEGSGEIGVYQRGTAVCIAPVENDKAELYAPQDCSYFLYGKYTKLALGSISFSNLNTSKVKSMQGMFDECTSLETLDWGSFDTSNVTTMMLMFRKCGQLASIDLSGFKTGNVISINQMFQDCTSLTELDLSGFDTSSLEKMSTAFGGCASLTSINLNGFSASKVEIMQGVFDGCTSLTSLDLSSFNTSSAKQMHYMFRNCTSLTELDLSSFNTGNVTLMREMFLNCRNLKTIWVGSGFDTAKVTNGKDKNMFTGCTSLVGGKGTTYDSSYTGKTYARIDGGPNSTTPGYFTGDLTTLSATGTSEASNFSIVG